jgi:hypothetical protein
MAEPSTGDPILARQGPLRSLASRFSFITAALVFGVVATILAYDLHQNTFDAGEGVLLCLIVILSAAISFFTTRRITRPLSKLTASLASARNGSAKLSMD